MRKVLLGMVVLAITLMSANFETKKGAIHYNDRRLSVPSSHLKPLSDKRVKDGLGYKDVREYEMSKAEVASLYKNKCKRCHGKVGRGGGRSQGARKLGDISRNELERILVTYAAGKPVEGRWSTVMVEKARSVTRVQISSLAKYISETF